MKNKTLIIIITLILVIGIVAIGLYTYNQVGTVQTQINHNNNTTISNNTTTHNNSVNSYTKSHYSYNLYTKDNIKKYNNSEIYSSYNEKTGYTHYYDTSTGKSWKEYGKQ